MSQLGSHRTAIAVIGAVIFLTACGSDDDTVALTEGKAGESAAELVDAVNEAMAGTTFHAIGGTTAFEDGQQEMWVDPEVGLFIEVTAPGLERGETYCQDGVIYTSVPLFTAQLSQAGEVIDVPPELENHYLSTQAGGDCSALFELFAGAALNPELNGEVDGTPSVAIMVESQDNTDVYHVAAEGEPYLLRLDSEYSGRKSTTVYDSFGEPLEITMPADEDVMSMEEFRVLIKGE